MMLANLMRRLLKGLLLGASAGLKLWAQAPATMPTATRDLPRGTIIAAADIRADSVDITRLTGWETRRMVKEGEALKAPAVAAPTLVAANAPVTLEVTVSGVRITRAATALARGTMGERIPVRLDAQRTVTAIVSGPATVRLAQGTDR